MDVSRVLDCRLAMPATRVKAIAAANPTAGEEYIFIEVFFKMDNQVPFNERIQVRGRLEKLHIH
jgi:hypothetical protein